MNGHTEDCIDGRGVAYLQTTLKQISEMISIDQFKAMLIKLEMKNPEAVEKDKELEVLIQSVNPLRLKNNPVALSTDVLEEMYRRIVK